MLAGERQQADTLQHTPVVIHAETLQVVHRGLLMTLPGHADGGSLVSEGESVSLNFMCVAGTKRGEAFVCQVKISASSLLNPCSTT